MSRAEHVQGRAQSCPAVFTFLHKSDIHSCRANTRVGKGHLALLRILAL